MNGELCCGRVAEVANLDWTRLGDVDRKAIFCEEERAREALCLLAEVLAWEVVEVYWRWDGAYAGVYLDWFGDDSSCCLVADHPCFDGILHVRAALGASLPVFVAFGEVQGEAVGQTVIYVVRLIFL